MILGCRNAHRTGRTRFRMSRAWGSKKLVLQVEWAGNVTRLLGPYPDTEWETWWADGKVEDLSGSKWGGIDSPA